MAAKIGLLREARAAFAASKLALEELENDPQVKKSIDFENQLRALMGKFSMSLVDINQLLDTSYKPPKVKDPVAAPAVGGKAAKTKRPRSNRIYTNPHNGDRIVYVGGVNKQLEEWKEKWGAEVVKGWGVLDKPAKAPKARKSHKSTGAQIVYEYINPHTSQVVRASNILKKELQQWIGQYGKEAVIGWRKDVAA